ncbi:MAG: hypothetical protein V3T77_11585 [Planctomycetota bacterium]
MDGIVCDRCGEGLLVEENVRYIMKLNIHAAYDPLEITAEDLQRDLQKEMEETLGKMQGLSEEELRRQVHFQASYDLCVSCQRSILADPLQLRHRSSP